MSQTVVVGIRLPADEAEKFEQQAKRFGLTRSAAGAALIESHLAFERQQTRRGEAAE